MSLDCSHEQGHKKRIHLPSPLALLQPIRGASTPLTRVSAGRSPFRSMVRWVLLFSPYLPSPLLGGTYQAGVPPRVIEAMSSYIVSWL